MIAALFFILLIAGSTAIPVPPSEPMPSIKLAPVRPVHLLPKPLTLPREPVPIVLIDPVPQVDPVLGDPRQ